MSESSVQWVKLSTGLFQNPKIIQLRALPGGERMILIWIMLLTLAGRCNCAGQLLLTDGVAYDLKMLAAQLHFSQKTLAAAFDQFVRLNMISDRDGVYAITNWEKYQNVEGMEKIREQNRARKKAQRSRDRHVTVTLGHATEEDEETETETEKEIHSFRQARQRELDERKREHLRGELGAGVVLLSNQQMDDLLDRLSLEEFDKYVAIVRDQELQGKHYRKKTHYQAILEMAEKDRGLL